MSWLDKVDAPNSELQITTYTSCHFFFFQAEDGIRDYKVTGVQTCALPIWPLPPRRDARRRRHGQGLPRHRPDARARGGRQAHQPRAALRQRVRRPLPARRSEERRVGKSVDLGGRRIIKKKKKKKL